LSTNPILLLVMGIHVEPAELPFATAVNDSRILKVRYDRAGFTSRANAERLSGRKCKAGRDHGRVVLLCAIDAVRILVIDGNLVHLCGRLICLRAPGASAIERDICAAIVCLDHVIGISGIDPEVMIIAMWNGSRPEGFAAVSALKPSFIPDVNDIRIIRVNSQSAVIERPRSQVARPVYERPGSAAVF
jgi:hypothetical protein